MLRQGAGGLLLGACVLYALVHRAQQSSQQARATQLLIQQIKQASLTPATGATQGVPAAAVATMELEASVLAAGFYRGYFEQRWQPQKLKAALMRQVFPARPYKGRCEVWTSDCAPFHVVFFSKPACPKQCAYFQGLKTGSMTIRGILNDRPECFAEVRIGDTSASFTGEDRCAFIGANCSTPELTRLSKVFKFAVFRNPLARVVSGYNYIRGWNRGWDKALCTFDCREDRKKVTMTPREEFHAFMLELYDRFQTDKAVNFHFHPQFNSFCVSHNHCFSLNKLLRTESLSADLVKLNESGRLGFKLPPNEKGGVVNAARKHPRHASKKDLKDETIVLICKIYMNDFACGGYALPAQCAHLLRAGPLQCLNLLGEPWKLEDDSEYEAQQKAGGGGGGLWSLLGR